MAADLTKTTGPHYTEYESAARGLTFTLSTPAAGVAVTALNVVSVTAAAPIIGLANPSTNAKVLSIRHTKLVVVTGTMCTGGFIWGAVSSGLAATAVGVSTYLAHGTYAAGGASGYAFDSTTAWNGAGASSRLRLLGGGVAGAAPAGYTYAFEEDSQDLVIGPGAAVGLFAANVATGLAVAATITWCEDVP